MQSALEILRVCFVEANFGGTRQARFVARPNRDAEIRGPLEDNGTMEICIPLDTAKVNVDLFMGEDDKQQSLGSYELALGHLDPTQEVSGVQARLRNLGYYSGPINGNLDEVTRRTISEFRSNFLGDDQGKMDTDFIEALDRAYYL